MKLQQEYQKYKELIHNSRFRKNLLFLINHPHLAFTNIDPLDLEENPNCWGTSVFVTNQNQKVRKLWFKEKGFVDHIDACGNYVCIPNNKTHGYVGEEPMELFLKEHQKTRKKKDTIITFNWNIPNTELLGYRIRHSGIYLDKNIFFHQISVNQRFCIGPIKDYIKTINKKDIHTLNIEHYKIN